MQALALRRRRPKATSSLAAPAAASSPTTTVQAPQSPSLQPSLVPVQRASSRSQSRTVRVGAAPSTSTTAPRWKKRIGRLDIGRIDMADTDGIHAIRMPPRLATPARIAIHGDLLDFSAEPAWGDVDSPAVRFRPDHWLLAEAGRIVAVQSEPPGEGWHRHDHGGRLVLPGFIDTHVHSPQIDVIASYGTELLDWLTTHTFPAEARHADVAHADAAAAH